MLENAKFIPTKLPPEWKNVIVSKDLTPVQREERKKFISNKKDTIQTKKNPGQNADHQNALVVNDTEQGDLALGRRELPRLGQKKLTIMKRTHIYRVPCSTQVTTPHLKQPWRQNLYI